MSEESKREGNALLECNSRSTFTDIAISPLVLLMATASFIAFAIYYMIIVEDIRNNWDLPLHFIITVYVLAIIAVLLSAAVCWFMMFMDRSHSRREADLRKHMIGYLEARYADVGIADRTNIERMIEADAEIAETEHPPSPRRILRALVVPFLVIFISVFFTEINRHLGEVFTSMMVLTLVMVQLIIPSLSVAVFVHESKFLAFYDIFRDAAAEVGMETIPFPYVAPQRDWSKMAKITVCTLGIGSIYWMCVMFRDRNAHFRSHRIIENKLIREIWTAETGHIPKI